VRHFGSRDEPLRQIARAFECISTCVARALQAASWMRPPAPHEPRLVDTDIPGRLDRLPWSRWHWRVVLALGITWLLDGLDHRRGHRR